MNLAINQVIGNLIREHDCVIIPNFGGFVARNVPAHISPGDGYLYPASKSILFNKNLINNDGLLANTLIIELGITYKEAMLEIDQFAAHIKGTLFKNARVELEDIGVLYLDLEKNIQFDSFNKTNLAIESFGLFPIALNKIELPTDKTPEQKLDRVESSKKDFFTNKKILKAAAIIAPVCVLLGFMMAVSLSPKNSFLSSLNPFSGKEKVSYTPRLFENHSSLNHELNQISSQKNIVSEETASFSIDDEKIVFVYVDKKSSDHAAVERLKSEILNKTNPYNPPPTSKNFEIIIGCFRDKKNADRMKTNAKKFNLSSKIVGKNEKDLFVVSAGGFTSLDSAASTLSKVREQYPDAWVLKK